MATVTDVLVTQLRIVGVAEVRSGLRDASFAFNQMAEAQGVATAATGALHAAFGALSSPLAALSLGVAAVSAEVAFLGKALAAFSDSEDTIARLAVQMRNLGNVFPIDALTEFSGRLSEATGIDDELIAKLGATAVGFGLTRQQIEQILPRVLDLSVGLKKAPVEVLTTLARATRGRTQGLFGLDFNPAQLKGDLHDIVNLVNQVSAGFAGTAEAFRGTLPGTVQALGVAVDNLFEAIGRFISPVVVPLLNLFIARLEQLTGQLEALAALLHLPTAAALGQGPANAHPLKGDPEQTELMRQTANNTAKLEPFINHVLGGTGEVAGRSFTWRDAKAAWGV